MYRVFLSHSFKDGSIADQLHAYLEASSGIAPPVGPLAKTIEVFLSEYDLAPRPNLDQGILAELNRADLFLLLLSEEASKSAYVNQEIGVAIHRGIERLVVALQPVTPPGMITRDNYIRLYENPQLWSASLKQHIDALASKKARNEAIGVVAAVVGLLWLLSGKNK